MNSFYNDGQILSFIIKYQSFGALISKYLRYRPIKHERRAHFVSAEIAVGLNNTRPCGRNYS